MTTPQAAQALADEAKRLSDSLADAEHASPTVRRVIRRELHETIDRLEAIATQAETPAAPAHPTWHTDAEMRRMAEAGTLPKADAWLVRCEGAPSVRPELRREFGWCEWHSPVWAPLYFGATPHVQ